MTTYKDAGVDIDKANALVEYIKERASKEGVLAEGFGGFALGYPLEGFRDPLLFTTTDGVGTKLKIAQEVGVHNTVGIDLVAMNVNDLITTGSKPLIFLDYIATGSIDLEVLKQVVDGIIEGCKRGKLKLAGGETAEMPGFYPKGVYDLAGFCLGACEREEVIDPKNVSEGDILIGLKSSGFHSNGYSLIRKVLKDKGISFKDFLEEFNKKAWEVLLEPTRIYVDEVLKVRKVAKVKAIAHITGGGIKENLARVIPNGFSAVVEKKNIPPMPHFSWIKDLGNIPEEEMFRTFNMGVGMVLIVSRDEADRVLEILSKEGFLLGEVRRGDERVKIV